MDEGKESIMNFVRGQDPKEAMGIGLDSILKEIGGIILREDAETWDHIKGDIENQNREELRITKYDLKNKNVIIGVSRERYTILKNRFQYDGPGEGDEKDLITVLLKLKESFINDPSFIFPLIQKVAARTIGLDLVAVKPMPAPSGALMYLDYRYKKQNIFKRIFNKIFPTKPSKNYII